MHVAHAKVAVPARPPRFVSRPRLLSLLDSADDAAVRIVCAPPGYGKTLLLADWARRAANVDTAWVTLDEDDNDSRRLWWAVLTALTVGPPDSADGVDPAIEAGDDLLADVVSHLDARTRPVRLILDRVDALDGEEARAGLAALIGHLPARAGLVLSSRVDLSASLPRPSRGGGLWKLPAQGLRFSPAEARRLLEACGARLTDAQVHRLTELAGGWAAGLRLSTQALRDAPDPDRFLAGFTGYDHPVADYLADEVLSRLPERSRAFLTAVSIADEFSPALATALSGRADAGRLLHALERETLLVSRIGTGEQVYTVQALARSYLRAKLERLDPRRCGELHAVAAGWRAARHHAVPAVDHATRAGDRSLAVQLLHRFGLTLLLTGAHPSLRQALDGIGAPSIADDPLLAALSAICHLEAGRVGAAEDDLRRTARGRTGGDGAALLRTGALLLQAHATGRPLPTPAVPERTSPAAADPGVSGLLHLIGEVDEGTIRRELERAHRLASQHGFGYLAMQVRVLLGAVTAVAGDYRSMSAAAGEAIELATAYGWQSSLWCSAAHSMVANAALLRAEPATAEHHASQALGAGGGALTPAVRFALESCRGAALFDSGQLADGLLQMQDARARFGRAAVSAEQATGAALLEHRAAVLLGDSSGAGAMLAWLLARVDAPGELLLMRAWSELSAGHHHAAAELVRAILSGAHRLVLPYSRVEALLVEAALELDAGRLGGARRALQAAFTVAEPIDVLRPFALSGPAVRDLLADDAAGFGPHRRFAARAAAAVERIMPPTARPLVSERELAVLYLLPSLLSLDEIAEYLSISTNTVKSHIRSIYAKLGVSNRRAAVATAHEHGLLVTTLV